MSRSLPGRSLRWRHRNGAISLVPAQSAEVLVVAKISNNLSLRLDAETYADPGMVQVLKGYLGYAYNHGAYQLYEVKLAGQA